MGWTDDLDEEARQEWDAFVRHVREETVKNMSESALVMSFAPGEGQFDVKFAVELGAAIMLDKPLLVIVQPGRPVPHRLAMVADKIVYADLDTEEGQREIAAALKVLGGVSDG